MGKLIVCMLALMGTIGLMNRYWGEGFTKFVRIGGMPFSYAFIVGCVCLIVFWRVAKAK